MQLEAYECELNRELMCFYMRVWAATICIIPGLGETTQTFKTAAVNSKVLPAGQRCF